MLLFMVGRWGRDRNKSAPQMKIDSEEEAIFIAERKEWGEGVCQN